MQSYRGEESFTNPSSGPSARLIFGMATGKPLALSQLNVPFSDMLQKALKVQMG